MLETLAAGLVFGLSAGLAPGPLLALTISQSVRHGLGAGVRVAVAPLVTDALIIAVGVVVAGSASGSAGVLAAISLAGAAVVAWLAWDTWRAEAPGADPAPADGVAAPGPASLRRGAVTNLLNPHPWLFWTAVGGPTLVAAFSSGGVAVAGAFLAGFYVALVGSKTLLAVAVSRARGLVVGRGYRLVVRALAVLLAGFAAGLVREAWRLLAG